MKDAKMIRWVRETPAFYDRKTINLLLDKLHRAKEILGSHHADLRPGEQQFWEELELAFSCEASTQKESNNAQE